MSSAPDKQLLVPWEEAAAGSAPLVVAEIGTGHGGDLARGRELIAAAAEAGADCVKFQHLYADEIIHPETGMVPLPGGDTPLYNVFRALERGPEFLAELSDAARQRGVAFLCTPFGSRSLGDLLALTPAALKIASPELNHLPLLEEIASAGVPLYLSAGVSRLGDIEEALDTVDGTPALLLHCVTSYPAPEEEYNLALLPLYRRLFGIPVGVSDHSLDSLLVPLLALSVGASVIEKHFTLDRGDGGLDDPVALPPAEFARMTRRLRESAALDAKALRRGLDEEFGPVRTAAVIGTGRKRLAPSERANYGRTNRSLHALRAIEAGEPFSEENCAVLRTEKILRPGVHPRFYRWLLGRRAAEGIPAGEGIRWSDIG